MTKKSFKILAILLIVFTLIASLSFCFADEKKEKATESSAEATEENQEEVYSGDLYIFNNDVTMDQLVDGNVYIMGNNVTVTGQVNGNLFVLANNVSFGTKAELDADGNETKKAETCYIRYSIFVAANNIYYNGACNDLYAAASQKLEMTYDSYVVRDVKAAATSTILKAAVGRDVDLQTNSVNFGEDKQVPIIYGDLRYGANEQKELAEGIVMGEVTYKANQVASTDTKPVGEIIVDILLSFLTVIATTIVIYLLLKVKPEIFKNTTQKAVTPGAILKCIGLGFATLVAGFFAIILLLISSISAKLAAILALILVLGFILATPIAIINIANLVKTHLKIETLTLSYVVLTLVAIVLHGISYIPYIGGLITFLIFLFGYGAILYTCIPQKELTEEEKQAKLEAKQAKLEQKAAKKEEKKAKKDTKKEEEKSKKEEKKAKKEEDK